MKNILKKRVYIFALLSLILILIVLSAPLLAPNDPYLTNPALIRKRPSMLYPLGTDSLGRCILSRVLYGGRISIFSSLFLVSVSFIVGTLLGIISAYYGGFIDTLIMRIVDIMLAFPQMVLAIAVAGILGGSLVNAMIATGITSWTLYARLARSHTLRIKNEAFIAAARLNRCSDSCIIRRHIFPNIMPSLLINALTQIGTTLMAIAGLSFLGLGVSPPNAEWGSMISEARAYMQISPMSVLAPAFAILLSIMLFNYFGDSLRDYLEYRG